MRGSRLGRRSWRVALRGVTVAVAALAALAHQPALAGASQKVINSPGSPLTRIYIDSDLACQVQAGGDSRPSFFGGTEPGACGTFLAVTADEEIDANEEPVIHHVFGPSLPEAVHPDADFTPVSQTLTGTGTEANPFVLTTHAQTIEFLEETEFEGAELVETDRYVSGQDFYTTTIEITNLGFAQLEGTLYHAGDCALSGLSTGYGAADVPATGSVACTIEPDDSPPGRYMAFTPTATSGPAPRFLESLSADVWSYVDKEAPQFPNAVSPATDQDNGVGVSWPISLKAKGRTAGGTASVSFTTTVSPTSPPTSSSTAGACVASGQVPVTVSAVNGPKAVRYVLDGAPVQSLPTNSSGQATISVTPGQHTLEYWGEDDTGVQESAHHTLSVTVASGGPSVKITSDQEQLTYNRHEAGSVTIVASGPGLTSDPSAAHVPIATATPGTFSVKRAATDACGTTEASYTYTVLTPPVLGKTVNLDVVSGTLFVALPPAGRAASFAGPLETAMESLSKGLKFIPLIEARQVPVGSVVQASAGVARVTTATATVGKLQSGEFGAGIFKLLQARKLKGLTELDIMNTRGARQVCASLGKGSSAGAREAKNLSSKVLGRLSGSAHGKYTTRGQYSAATVRGTVWSVANQCDGTLTKVKRGVVTVRDFRRRKTITLFTGQQYLARSPL